MDLASIVSSVLSSNNTSMNNTPQGVGDQLSTQEVRTTTTRTIQQPTQAMNSSDEADMQKYDSELRGLNDMGFTDMNSNLEMIRLANGDINLAIEYLVGSGNKPE